jgi:hypothetical protein
VANNGRVTGFRGAVAREPCVWVVAAAGDFSRSLNLSAIIGYGLNVYGSLVSDFTATNSGQVRAVVLLVCAPKLTSSDGPPDGAMSLWQKIDTWPDDFFGINLLRRCLLAYIVDTPLQRAGAEFFGFSSELDAYQTAHDGSLINFGNFTIHQPMDTSSAAPLALSQEIKAESRIFRGQVPVGTKLFIGLTPGPTSFVSAQEARERPELLREWNRFIRADVMLTNLPSTLPDWCFSESKHLNQIGQKRFTALLAKELAPLLSGTNAPASLSSP